MEYVRAARLVSRQVRIYLEDVLPLARETVRTSFEAVYLLLRLTFHLVRPLFTLVILLYKLLFPYLLYLGQKLWAAFSLQPAEFLAIEAGIACSILALSYLERRFRIYKRVHRMSVGTARACRRRYRRLLSNVRQKSRLAAGALPHLLFYAIISFLQSYFGRFLAPFTQGSGMLLLACVGPAVRTVLLLYAVEVEAGYDSTPATLPDSSDSEYVPSPQDIDISSVLQNTSTADTPVRRRRRPSTSTTPDPLARAAAVAQEIENDGAEANVMLRRSSRVTIMDTPKPVRARREMFATPRPGKPPVDDLDARNALEIRTLRFWVVFGVVWGTRSVMWYFSPSVMENFIKTMDNWLFYFFLWAQIGMTSGADVLYSVIASVARRRWKLGEVGAARLNILLRFIVAAGLVKSDRADEISESMAEYGLAMLGVVFLITPRVATFLGTVFIGLIVPCYLSTSVVECGDGTGFGRHNWLSYWGVISLVEAGFAASADMCGWVPLWYHAKMMMILWLQLPYYRGSVTILDWVMDRVGSALTSVKKQVVTPRKRKRA